MEAAWGADVADLPSCAASHILQSLALARDTWREACAVYVLYVTFNPDSCGHACCGVSLRVQQVCHVGIAYTQAFFSSDRHLIAMCYLVDEWLGVPHLLMCHETVFCGLQAPMCGCDPLQQRMHGFVTHCNSVCVIKDAMHVETEVITVHTDSYLPNQGPTQLGSVVPPSRVKYL
jgi:hypothetical protein